MWKEFLWKKKNGQSFQNACGKVFLSAHLSVEKKALGP